MIGTGIEGLDLIAEIGFRHLWQSLLIVGIVGFLLLRKNQWSAEHRSWIWTSAMLMMGFLPILTLLPLPSLFAGFSAPTTAQAQSLPALLQQAYHYDADFIAPLTTTLSKSFLGSAPFWGLLLGLWASISIWHFAKLVTAWHHTYALRKKAVALSPDTAFIPNDWPKDVTIAASEEIKGPMAIGLLHPSVLLPANLSSQLTHIQLRHVLAHELAHIERGDLRLAFLQRVLLAIFWWSPLMHAACKQLQDEREMACDDRAVKRAGCSRNYASSLVDSVEAILFEQKDTSNILAVGAFNKKGDRSFSERIKRLLKADYAGQVRLGTVHSAGLLFAVVITASIFILTPRNAFSAVSPASSYAEANCVALIEAIKNRKYTEKTALIKKGVAPDCTSKKHGSPLIMAASKGDISVIKYLVKEGADPNKAVSGNSAPLIHAAANGHKDAVSKLISLGADVNVQAAKGKTPLITAAHNGHLEIVKMLLKKGAKPDQIAVSRDGKKITALGVAKAQGHKEIAAYLKKYLKYNTNSS